MVPSTARTEHLQLAGHRASCFLHINCSSFTAVSSLPLTSGGPEHFHVSNCPSLTSSSAWISFRSSHFVFSILQSQIRGFPPRSISYTRKTSTNFASLVSLNPSMFTVLTLLFVSFSDFLVVRPSLSELALFLCW